MCNGLLGNKADDKIILFGEEFLILISGRKDIVCCLRYAFPSTTSLHVGFPDRARSGCAEKLFLTAPPAMPLPVCSVAHL